MYLNTGETDWEENWYNIFDENIKKNNLRNEIKKEKNINKYPIVLHHGNNPGLVSHFVKAGLEYIVRQQFKNDEKLNDLLENRKFNELAKELDLRQIHVNDNDFQIIKEPFEDNKLYSTWSVDSFFFELLSEATACLGTKEKSFDENDYSKYDKENGFINFKEIAFDKIGKTYYPKGKFEGYLVPHEETITIAKSLEIKNGDKVVYRPSVIFLYSPCDYSVEYLKRARVHTDISLMEQKEKFDTIIRGFNYPKSYQIVYNEHIKKGTEYVGVLLLGSKFNPVWVGNRINKHFLYKNKKESYWQTPTITPVSMSALAACCWMIENKDKGGIYFPDEIDDYKFIISFAEKYISKTIFKTFKKNKIEKELEINLNDVNLKDIIK